MTDALVSGLWGRTDHEWSARNSEGRSRGILTIWRKDVLQSEFSFSGKGFLGIMARCKGSIFYFINIYSPCSLIDKRSLWAELLDWKQKLERGEWVIGGDFNSIKNRDERRGKESLRRDVEMGEFGSFIENMELIDTQIIGGSFTWIKPNGKACSRLDRILVSEGLISKWGVVAQEVGNRDILDHKPVWLKSSRVEWGPKPFRLNQCWFEHKDFKSFVQKEWTSFSVKESIAFALKERFKNLRGRLRWWNINVFGEIDLKIEEDVLAMNKLEEVLMQHND
ncbi:uncharacterized protein LOC131649760 [Vicia villosa]|uniref:uncharacterized protein LOC131649760 n=1 Tax=Vicia villosa TaxID=3911 RepID=UPI00273BF520|nr:uncharacterized protein LOC131649760 [Vicia villosa]